jgi:hypothetical protein
MNPKSSHSTQPHEIGSKAMKIASQIETKGQETLLPILGSNGRLLIVQREAVRNTKASQTRTRETYESVRTISHTESMRQIQVQRGKHEADMW